MKTKPNIPKFELVLAVLIFFQMTCLEAQKIGENFVAFEAEETTSDLGLWKIIKPDNPNYFNPGPVAPVNDTHMEFTGNTHNGGAAKSPLEYKFICPKTGTYRVVMRMWQRLEGQPNDKCNDVYVKMAGDFTSASGKYTTTELKNNLKYYGRGTTTWGVCSGGESPSTHVKSNVQYNLIEGKEYTFTMSGRSQRTNIDYILFYDITIPMVVQSYKDLAEFNDPKFRPSLYDCETFNAVDFTYTNIDGFSDGEPDLKDGKSILSIGERLAWAAAQLTADVTDGMAIFKINAMQETDGESTYKLKINGELIGQGTNDRIHNTTIPDYTIQTHEVRDTAVQLNDGDLIQVEFNNATNGLVPEGDLTATARGRWLSLDICTTGIFPNYGLLVSKENLTLAFGGTEKLEVTINLPEGADEAVTWSSDNESIASVAQNGTVTAIAAGKANITVTSVNGKYSATTSVNVRPEFQTAYGGTPHVIPGIIESVNFDEGGEGMSYHDLTVGNVGNGIRQDEDVDTEYRIEAGSVGWIGLDEWLEYTVNVAQAGKYIIDVMVASTGNSGAFHIEFDEVDKTGKQTVASTGDWGRFEKKSISSVELDTGEQVMRFYADGAGFNLATITIRAEVNVAGISMSPEELSLDKGQKIKLIYTIAPEGASDTSVTWKSDDTSVATVDGQGNVTAISDGVTTITVTSIDGAFTAATQVTIGGIINNVKGNKLHADFEIYPNPFTKELIINSEHSYAEAQLVDSLGKILVRQNITSNSVKLSPSYALVPTGMYFIRLIGAKGVKTYKVFRAQ